MNSRFPVLSTVSSLLKVVGWLVVIAAFLYVVYEGIYEPNQREWAFGGQDFIQVIAGVVLGLLGLLTVAVSEVIGVLFAIEENTRANRQ